MRLASSRFASSGRLRLAASPILAAGIVLAGCGPKPATNDTTGTTQTQTGAAGTTTAPAPASGAGRIMVLTNGTSPFWAAVEHGMNDADKQLGANAQLIRNDGTVPGQIQRLDQVLAQADVKGVAISVLDAGAQGIADKMRALQKKGVFVVALDSDGQKDTRYAYIGANNVAAGIQAGQAAAQLLPGGGKVVAFVGTQAAANAKERLQGFKSGAGPKFDVVEVMEDASDPAKAHRNVEAAIQAHKEANLLLGLWSYNAPAIADEIQRANMRSHYKIVTFDAEPNTVTALGKGIIDATVIQQPYEYGFQAVKLLHALIDKDDATVKAMVPAGKIVNVPCRTVAADAKGPVKGPNVITFDALKKYLAEKNLKGT